MSEKKRDFWGDGFVVLMMLLVLFVVALFVVSVAVPGETFVVSGHRFGSGNAYMIEVEGEWWWQSGIFAVPESTWLSYEVGDVWDGVNVDG